MFSDSTRQGKRFRRMIPRLFQKSRVVQIGEPLKVSEARKQRNRWCYQCFSRSYWPFCVLFTCFTVAAFCFGWREVFPTCLVLTFYMPFFGLILFCIQDQNYIPFRWIIVRDGIWLRSSKDVSRFLPWRSIVQIDTKPAKSSRQLSRLDLLTVEGERLTLKAKSDDLLRFANKLAEILPHAIDPEPLQDLQRQLRHRRLYDALFLLRETFAAFGMFMFIPIFVLLHAKFVNPAEVGFVTWGVVMGMTLLICIGIFIMFRRAVVRRNNQHVERLMLELDEMDVAPLLQEENSHSPRHAFGTPPRIVPPDVRRRLLFSGEPVEMLQLCWFLALVAVLFGGILWWEDPAALRYGFLPFRWQPTHAGVIVAIADSSTERAPNGNPAPGGCDVITLEQTLHDGRTIRCRQPSWPSHGNFMVGQKVSLLRYVNDETCLQIDDPLFRNWTGLWAGLVFGTLFFVFCCGFVMASFSRRKRVVKLLETANVVKFRIRKRARRKQGKTILTLVGRTGEPLEILSQGGYQGETVHVFLDEAKPKQSLIAERLRGDLRYDAETGEIECDPDPLTRYAKWSPSALALGVGIIVSRLIWVW